jgi:hypothetical protein
MIHSYMFHDSFIRVTRLIHVCDMTNSYVCYNSQVVAAPMQWEGTLQHTASHCHTLQHSATLCNTLQHSATLCNTLQHSATPISELRMTMRPKLHPRYTATHCNTHCNILQHSATLCNTLQHPYQNCEGRCVPNYTHGTLQHTATHYNTLQHTQHTATPIPKLRMTMCSKLQPVHCNTLQHTTTHYNTLQYPYQNCE